MTDIVTPTPMLVQDTDGSTRSVLSIASNEDHVGNLIAKGDLAEADRYPTLVRVYKRQFAALHRRILQERERNLKSAQATLYANHWADRILEYQFEGEE